jgi:rare lipoprotein A
MSGRTVSAATRLLRPLAALGIVATVLAGCSGSREPTGSGSDQRTHANLPKGVYKIGKPYVINGRRYYPEFDPDYDRVGVASWYGSQFHGLSTANGEVFDKEEISAAHPTLPLPSLVRVTNLENGRVLKVRVNDRGPFVDDRMIDLSQAGARELGFENKGLARVRVEFLEIAGDARGTPPTPTVVASAERIPARGATPDAHEIVRASVVSREAAPDGRARITESVTIATPGLPAQSRPTLIASVSEPAGSAACGSEPQYVQVGAFSESARVRAAEAHFGAFERVSLEPVFVGERAVMRVRLGPVADRPAADGLLARVRAEGYSEAFVVSGRSSAATTSC